MGLFKTWSDLENLSQDFSSQLLRGVKSVGCKIWEDYSWWFVPSNAIGSETRWFWNNICTPPTQPQSANFSGGQCATTYRVGSYQVFPRWERNPNCPGIFQGNLWLPATLVNPIQGPIQSIQWVTNFSTPCPLIAESFSARTLVVTGAGGVQLTADTGAGRWRNSAPTSATTCTANVQTNPSATYWRNEPISLQFFIERVDGLPDNCGDQTPGYPPLPPPPPEGVTYQIEIFDVDQNLLIVPVTWDGDFNFPIKLTARFGLIYIDVGGITLNWNGDFNINVGGDPEEEQPKNPVAPAPPEYQPPARRIPRPGDPDVFPSPPVEVEEPDPSLEEEEEEDEEILWVEILLISPPLSPRHQILQVNSSDSVYYCGWVAWTAGGGALNSAPEIPIRRSRTLLPKPPEYTGYRVRAINGAVLQVTDFRRKQSLGSP